MIGPKEQTVRDGIDPREEYTSGESLLLRAKLAEARAEDLQAEIDRRQSDDRQRARGGDIGVMMMLSGKLKAAHAELAELAVSRDRLCAEVAEYIERTRELHERWRDAVSSGDLARADVERLRGILKAVADWSEDGLEDGGAPWSCRVCGETGDPQDLHDGRCPVGMAVDALTREPDPSHTPAVRRVVAWDGGDGLTEDIESAYIDAAVVIVDGDSDSARRMHRRWWHLSNPEYDVARDRVIDRLARYKRHRDESAGYR